MRPLALYLAAPALAVLCLVKLACYAHVPPKPGEPNPADYPAVHDRKAPDGGPR